MPKASLARIFRRNAARLARKADTDRTLSHGAVRTLHRLLAYANASAGLCFPSQETLARDVGRTVRRVSSYLRQLLAAGYLRWSRRRRMSNQYAFRFGEVDAKAGPLEWQRFNESSYPPSKARLLSGRFAAQRPVRPVVAEVERVSAAPGPVGDSAPLPLLSAAALAISRRGRGW